MGKPPRLQGRISVTDSLIIRAAAGRSVACQWVPRIQLTEIDLGFICAQSARRTLTHRRVRGARVLVGAAHHIPVEGYRHNTSGSGGLKTAGIRRTVRDPGVDE